MRKKDDTLRETLLYHARRLVDSDGMDALNIRALAKMSGVATGTVYNYFSGKDDIILVLTEDNWKKLLDELQYSITAVSFHEQLEEVFLFLKEQLNSSAGKFMSSLGTLEAEGKKRMITMQTILEKTLLRRMEQDVAIRADIWDENFTKEAYAHFILVNMLAALQTPTPDFYFFLEIVKRTLY